MIEQGIVLSQIDIEQEIIRLTAVLEEETDKYAILLKGASKKEAKYKSEWAKSYLAANGSVKERESWADYKQADLLFETKIADALVKANKEKLLSVRAALDALRTLAANLRVQT